MNTNEATKGEQNGCRPHGQLGLARGDVCVFRVAVLHGLSGGWKLTGCIEACPDGVTAVSAGGPPCGWNLGIPWSHPVATWAAGRLAQGLSDPCVDTTMQ